MKLTSLLYPARNSYKRKLIALLEGLETQHIDKLIKEGKIGDFRAYGELYVKAVREKIEGGRKTPCDCWLNIKSCYCVDIKE